MKTDKSSLIETYLQCLGSSVTVTEQNGTVTQTHAVISGAWTKVRQHFEEKAAMPGRYSDLYYYYIGPPSFDVTRLTRDDTLSANGKLFFFTQSEAVTVGGIVQYYRGLLKKTEANDDVFNG